MTEQLLHDAFLRASGEQPNRPALDVDGAVVTYGELRRRAASLAATLQQKAPQGGAPLAAVFAQRSATGFAGILGALMAGVGYVPLNRSFPVSRTRWMLENAGCRAIVVDGRCEEQLDVLLEGIATPMLVVLPDRVDVSEAASRWSRHVVLGAGELGDPETWIETAPPVDTIAYLLYTSGTTGVPKGVTVSHANASYFVRSMVERYGVTADDRFSQMFETTFDLSVFDLFVPWSAGAQVCCPSSAALLNPDRFIREKALTVWFSVPSVGLLMKRLHLLREGRYPSLRVSLFCGEPLPADVAESWSCAAPGAILENLYGPTELTVACSVYRWNGARSTAESALGIVPIGEPLPGMDAVIVDDQLREVGEGEVGELLMSGPQCTAGYWRNAEATERSYVRLPQRDRVYYRTGDRVRRPSNGGPMTYVGRADHQIKILGHRVELGEIESRLREEPGVEAAVAVGWPLTAAGPAGIVAFLTGHDLDGGAIRARLKTKLQEYAVPRAIHVLPDLPQNANGKVDRKALLDLLQA